MFQVPVAKPIRPSKPARGKRSGRFRRILLWMLAFLCAIYAGFAALIVALKWVNPPTTAVQIERRVSAMLSHRPYRKRYTFVPLRRIAPDLQHAVIAAEDARFYQHHGIDWNQVQKVLDKDVESGKLGRGASTITQQLIKNLFLTTKRSLIRKGIEFSLVPLVEGILGKQRILELYLNVIEWGPGVYGAEAASGWWYRVPASQISRDQAARLAAIIPLPLKRKPQRMNEYSSAILERMRQMGW
jgi:monofunctional glycosyltransferase